MTDAIKSNFSTLHTRERGDRYTVQDGHLKKMGFASSLVDRVKCFVLKSFSERSYLEHKKPVRDALDALCHSDLESLDISVDKAEKPKLIAEVFFNKLSVFNDSLFDRSKISDKTVQILTKAVTEGSKDTTQESQNSPSFQHLVATAKLGHRLGIKTLSGGGCSGSYVFKDLKGRKIGIFKPAGEDSLGKKPPALWRRGWNAFCRALGVSGSRYKTMGNVAHLAEAATYKIAEKKGGLEGLVPLTGLTYLPTEKGDVKFGSFQEYNQETFSATTYFNMDKDYQPIGSQFLHIGERAERSDHNLLEEFQKLVILDVITGNLDRHAENWLVIPKNGKVIAIDGGMSFSDTHSETTGERDKQYHWAKQFALANTPFTETSKALIKHYYDNRDDYAKEIQDLFQLDTDKSPDKERDLAAERAQRFIERVEMLYHFSLAGTPKAVRELVNYRTGADIVSFIENPYQPRFTTIDGPVKELPTPKDGRQPPPLTISL